MLRAPGLRGERWRVWARGARAGAVAGEGRAGPGLFSGPFTACLLRERRPRSSEGRSGTAGRWWPPRTRAGCHKSC